MMKRVVVRSLATTAVVAGLVLAGPAVATADPEGEATTDQHGSATTGQEATVTTTSQEAPVPGGGGRGGSARTQPGGMAIQGQDGAPGGKGTSGAVH